MSKEDKEKKHKSNWFRVAVAGDTTDGREIQSDWIIQMADSYDPNTYGARINIEHLRSVYPGSAFGAYGDVLALKTEKVTIDDEERDALFAQIEPTQGLIELNKQKQKVYTSIEVDPNFANKGKAYLIGLAVTDSPASLGTEMLQFAANAKVNPLADKKQRPENLFTAAQEVTLEFEEVKEQQSYSAGLLDKVKKLFSKQEQTEKKSAESFSEQEQAIVEIAQETANQAETDAKTAIAKATEAISTKANQTDLDTLKTDVTSQSIAISTNSSRLLSVENRLAELENPSIP